MDNENHNEAKYVTVEKKSGGSYLMPLSILIAGVLIAGAVLYSQDSDLPKVQQASVGDVLRQQPNNPPVNIEDVDIKGEPFIGDPNAPVVLVYWLDFQCPFCKRFETTTLPVLVSKYVDKGKLKVVFKDFQFLGPDSQDAGLVSKAVWELYPDYYFKWHQAMFEAQDEENGGFGDLASILDLIRKKIPEINADKIAAQVENKRDEYQQEQDADKAEGASFGINGTPGFIIGSQKITGAQPTPLFTQIIDAELAKSQ